VFVYKAYLTAAFGDPVVVEPGPGVQDYSWATLQASFLSGSLLYPALWIRIRIRAWIRIDYGRLNQELGSRRAKMIQKIGKNYEISSFEVLDVLFCGLKAPVIAWTSFMET
jgi:hypothetical protein